MAVSVAVTLSAHLTAALGAVTAQAAPADAAPHAVTQSFVFENLPQSWLILPLLALAAALAWWSWKRYGPAPKGAIGVLAKLCRAAALAVCVLILAGPAWKRVTTSELPYHILVAVDRSASMSRADGPQGQTRISQAGALATALEALKPANPLLAITYQAIGGVHGAIDPKDLLAGTLTAPGAASPLGDELDRLVTDERPDLVVVASDGRVTVGSSLAVTAGRWPARDLQTLTLATGTDAVEPELFTDEIEINREAALGEIEPVEVRLSGRALPHAPVVVSMTIDGEPAGMASITPAEVAQEARAQLQPVEAHLDATFSHEGPAKVRITASCGTGADKVSAISQELTVQVRERKLSVLMLGHRPFYELRYMREAFKRDKSVTLHAYLAEGRWRRWGVDGPDNLPLQPAELSAYDVIIIGDVGREAFQDADLAHIDKAVRGGGAGLVWMMSETGAIATYENSPLADLLPAHLPDQPTVVRGFLEAVPRYLSRTPISIKLGLLDPVTGDGGLDWPQLPPLLGAAPLAGLKAGAEPLAVDQNGAPLVVTKAYPPGRSILLAVDDTWRWRRNVGDRYLHRFQSQLLRYAASGRRGGSRAWRLFVSPRRAIPGELITINLSPLGQPDSPPENVTVSLTGPGGAQQLVRLEHDGEGFSARITAPGPPGSWTLAVEGGIDERKVDPGELKVLAPEDELRDPRLDRPGLDAFATATGGKVFTSPATLVAALPRDLRKSDSVITLSGLWDSWWSLLLITLLFAIEWSLRRASRLP